MDMQIGKSVKGKESSDFFSKQDPTFDRISKSVEMLCVPRLELLRQVFFSRKAELATERDALNQNQRSLRDEAFAAAIELIASQKSAQLLGNANYFDRINHQERGHD